MAIKIGENDVKTLKVGDKQVKKLYQGAKLVWEDFKGFTFEGEKTRKYRIEFVSMEETDPSKFKNLWAIVDGIDRLIWSASSGNVLVFTIQSTKSFFVQEDSAGRSSTFVFYDTGEELPSGEYTFKVELI